MKLENLGNEITKKFDKCKVRIKVKYLSFQKVYIKSNWKSNGKYKKSRPFFIVKSQKWKIKIESFN